MDVILTGLFGPTVTRPETPKARPSSVLPNEVGLNTLSAKTHASGRVAAIAAMPSTFV